MNKRRRYKAKRQRTTRRMRQRIDALVAYLQTRWPQERQKGDDDGVEYGHPGDYLRGLE
jgi:hypothetical protein